MDAKIGIVAALVSIVFHGSFTVPMKGKAANSVKIDPLVFQTFKSAICFLTCWVVLLLGEELKFKPLVGILSASLWVPGGTAGIFAVRNAGIAISVGIWSSVVVIVSYAWGILIFKEKVKSGLITFLSILFLILGIIGMSFSSSPKHNEKEKSDEDESEYNLTICTDAEYCGEEVDPHESSLMEQETSYSDLSTKLLSSPNLGSNNLRSKGKKQQDEVRKCLTENGEDKKGKDGVNNFDIELVHENDMITIVGKQYSRRTLGLIGAIFNGLCAGFSFVPMHYLSDDEKGLSFVISFAVGAVIVTTSLWVLRYIVNICAARSATKAFGMLPSFHLKVMWLPGCISGLLWSIGNIGNIMAVTYLGQGVGLSMTQACLIVSGLWGIIYYKEIRHVRMIILWFIAAFVTILSIYVLCEQRSSDRSKNWS